jgi:hypothetical protein
LDRRARQLIGLRIDADDTGQNDVGPTLIA